MRLVIIESPYAGDVAANEEYARRCVKDSLDRGEAPIAFHLLYPQVLNDDDPRQRELAIECNLAWQLQADAIIVYRDRGISPGMQIALDMAHVTRIPIEVRSIG